MGVWGVKLWGIGSSQSRTRLGIGLKFLGTRQIHFRPARMRFRLTIAIGFGQLVLLTVTFAEEDPLTGVFHFEAVESYSSRTEPQTESLESKF